MGLFNRLFSPSKKLRYNFADEPTIFFGRYTDRNKTKLQYAHWEKSIHLYKDKKYLKAYEHFFYYLDDDSVNNVLFSKTNNRINFEFIQGSKIVKGWLNTQEVFAEAEVVRFDDISIPVMRKLLLANNQLNYCKFAIKNDVYSLKYFSPIEDANPKTLYSALRELAIEADLFDDILINLFKNLHPINMEHIKEINLEEKQLKLKYFRIWVELALQRVNGFEIETDSLKISQILQILLFKIYYLLAPEGVLLDDIKYLQKSLSNSTNNTVGKLNISITDTLKAVLKKTDKELMKSLYRVEYTFAVNRPTNFNQVKTFINDEMIKVNSYVSDNQYDNALSACEYILCYSSFMFGMPEVVNHFLQLVWRVFNSQFFNELGFADVYYFEEDNKLNVELISAKIESIIGDSEKQYAKMKFKLEHINFDDRLKFVISFFNEFKNLNYD